MPAYIHSAQVRKLTATGEDSGGQATGTWANEITVFGCRIWAAGGKEIYPGAQMVQGDYVMNFPMGISITEKDRVASAAIGGIDEFEVIFVQPVNGPIGPVYQKAFLRGIK